MSLQKQLKSPITWLAIGGLVLVWMQWRPGWLGRAFARQQSDYYRNLQTQYQWRVQLKDDKVVVMNNNQLANALDAGAVKTYARLKTS